MRQAFLSLLGVSVAVLAISSGAGAQTAAPSAAPGGPGMGAEHPAAGAGEHAWTTIDAEHIVAVQTKWGVVTSAEVQLRMCYQARIVARSKTKFDYVVEDEREPGAGEICGMAIRSATVAISEAGTAHTVDVTTAEGTTSVTPALASAIMRF